MQNHSLSCRLSCFFPFDPIFLNFIKQAPVLNLEGFPDPRRKLDCVANQPALLAEFQVDVVLIVLALDVGHVDGNQDISGLLLQAKKGQDDGGEIRRLLG